MMIYQGLFLGIQNHPEISFIKKYPDQKIDKDETIFRTNVVSGIWKKAISKQVEQSSNAQIC